MRNKNVTFMVQAAIIAALYVVLTFVANALGLASHTIQVRFSEALCILPFFTPAAIPGLWIGCLIANLATGAVIWDIIFGSIATLLGAIGTYLLRRHKFLCTLPPVISNMIIVLFILVYGYGIPRVYLKNVDVTIIFNAMTVGIGEVISVCVLGSILLNVLNKYKDTIFRQNADKGAVFRSLFLVLYIHKFLSKFWKKLKDFTMIMCYIHCVGFCLSGEK